MKTLVNGREFEFDPEDYIIVPAYTTYIHSTKRQFSHSGQKSKIYSEFKILNWKEFLKRANFKENSFLNISYKTGESSPVSVWKDKGPFVEFFAPQDGIKSHGHYALFSDCHHPVPDEMKSYLYRKFQEEESRKNWELHKSLHYPKVEEKPVEKYRSKMSDLGEFVKPREIRTLNPSEDYSFEEELKNLRKDRFKDKDWLERESEKVQEWIISLTDRLKGLDANSEDFASLQAKLKVLKRNLRAYKIRLIEVTSWYERSKAAEQRQDQSNLPPEFRRRPLA